MNEEDRHTHLTEWADLIGDSVPDSVQLREEHDEPRDDDGWNVGF